MDIDVIVSNIRQYGWCFVPRSDLVERYGDSRVKKNSRERFVAELGQSLEKHIILKQKSSGEDQGLLVIDERKLKPAF